MDPNEALARMRSEINRFRVSGDGEGMDEAQLYGVLLDLVEAAESLDGWLTNGGFAPDAWRASQR